MKNKIFQLIVITTLLTVVFSGCSNSTSNTDNTTTGKPTLLFFLLPSGAPCQAQDKILKEEVLPNYKDSIDTKYIKADDQNSQNTFYEYGVRSIPLIIILDKEGKTSKRFTPGIQDSQTIIEELKKVTI